MRTAAWAACGFFLGAMMVGAPLHAQTCDFQLLSASWSPHPHPDSIYINFQADVVGPASADPLNPTEYDMQVNIRFNGVPLDPIIHELKLRWWHSVGCPAGCPNVICEEKEWSFKGSVWRDQSRCTFDPQHVCGCPRLGVPVPQKPVKKPPGPGTIEIEIIPLHLQSCNPINPENDRRQFPYPGGGGGGVPALPPAGVVFLISGLVLLGSLLLYRRSTPGRA